MYWNHRAIFSVEISMAVHIVSDRTNIIIFILIFFFFRIFIFATGYVVSFEDLLKISGSFYFDVRSVLVFHKCTALLMDRDINFHLQTDFIVAIAHTFSLYNDFALRNVLIALHELTFILLVPCCHYIRKVRLTCTN